MTIMATMETRLKNGMKQVHNTELLIIIFSSSSVVFDKNYEIEVSLIYRLAYCRAVQPWWSFLAPSGRF